MAPHITSGTSHVLDGHGRKASVGTVRHPWWDGSVWGATGSGRGADRAGEPPPRREPGKRCRQVQYDPPHRALDPHRKLEQPFAQCRDLGTGTGGACGSTSQLLEQEVGRERQQHPELVGEEALAALVTRDAMIGVAKVKMPVVGGRG